MKKIIFFILIFGSILFLGTCVSDQQGIQQKIEYNTKEDVFTITTFFDYPYIYNERVYCSENNIDSVKIVEYEKAKQIQKIMIDKN